MPVATSQIEVINADQVAMGKLGLLFVAVNAHTAICECFTKQTIMWKFGLSFVFGAHLVRNEAQFPAFSEKLSAASDEELRIGEWEEKQNHNLSQSWKKKKQEV